MAYPVHPQVTWILPNLKKVGGGGGSGEKEKMVSLPAFSPFPTIFLSINRYVSSFEPPLICRLLILSIWTC